MFARLRSELKHNLQQLRLREGLELLAQSLLDEELLLIHMLLLTVLIMLMLVVVMWLMRLMW